MVTSSPSPVGLSSDPSAPSHLATANAVVAKFKALADPLRFEVVELLRQQEMCVCDLCDRLGVAQSKLSFHLKALRQAELITARQDGRWMYYSLNLVAFQGLDDYLQGVSQCRPCQPAPPCLPPPQDDTP
ncbi:metalloregulator ArsR/SmtB family transcription factor [Nodosilinea sp. P-1105]|uniref:ArsR/SmtB family transcription factor n=1 Tax=Nodosilinea sp. P-1105 TaxID=2546229 RepID=UPI00146E066A|nr:metalloregulator ArsR/SmtB family transcription factor [Nodosilinea sp. P-1105]NMF85682.1 ArsR family transcriptional regulator [Nodosilinea sp. P-1105]